MVVTSHKVIPCSTEARCHHFNTKPVTIRKTVTGKEGETVVVTVPGPISNQDITTTVIVPHKTIHSGSTSAFGSQIITVTIPYSIKPTATSTIVPVTTSYTVYVVTKTIDVPNGSTSIYTDISTSSCTTTSTTHEIDSNRPTVTVIETVMPHHTVTTTVYPSSWSSDGTVTVTQTNAEVFPGTSTATVTKSRSSPEHTITFSILPTSGGKSQDGQLVTLTVPYVPVSTGSGEALQTVTVYDDGKGHYITIDPWAPTSIVPVSQSSVVSASPSAPASSIPIMPSQKPNYPWTNGPYTSSRAPWANGTIATGSPVPNRNSTINVPAPIPNKNSTINIPAPVPYKNSTIKVSAPVNSQENPTTFNTDKTITLWRNRTHATVSPNAPQWNKTDFFTPLSSSASPISSASETSTTIPIITLCHHDACHSLPITPSNSQSTTSTSQYTPTITICGSDICGTHTMSTTTYTPPSANSTPGYETVTVCESDMCTTHLLPQPTNTSSGVQSYVAPTVTICQEEMCHTRTITKQNPSITTSSSIRSVSTVFWTEWISVVVTTIYGTPYSFSSTVQNSPAPTPIATIPPIITTYYSPTTTGSASPVVHTSSAYEVTKTGTPATVYGSSVMSSGVTTLIFGTPVPATVIPSASVSRDSTVTVTIPGKSQSLSSSDLSSISTICDIDICHTHTVSSDINPAASSATPFSNSVATVVSTITVEGTPSTIVTVVTDISYPDSEPETITDSSSAEASVQTFTVTAPAPKKTFTVTSSYPVSSHSRQTVTVYCEDNVCQTTIPGEYIPTATSSASIMAPAHTQNPHTVYVECPVSNSCTTYQSIPSGYQVSPASVPTGSTTIAPAIFSVPVSTSVSTISTTVTASPVSHFTTSSTVTVSSSSRLSFATTSSSTAISFSTTTSTVSNSKSAFNAPLTSGFTPSSVMSTNTAAKPFSTHTPRTVTVECYEDGSCTTLGTEMAFASTVAHSFSHSSVLTTVSSSSSLASVTISKSEFSLTTAVSTTSIWSGSIKSDSIASPFESASTSKFTTSSFVSAPTSGYTTSASTFTIAQSSTKQPVSSASSTVIVRCAENGCNTYVPAQYLTISGESRPPMATVSINCLSDKCSTTNMTPSTASSSNVHSPATTPSSRISAVSTEFSSDEAILFGIQSTPIITIVSQTATIYCNNKSCQTALPTEFSTIPADLQPSMVATISVHCNNNKMKCITQTLSLDISGVQDLATGRIAYGPVETDIIDSASNGHTIIAPGSDVSSNKEVISDSLAAQESYPVATSLLSTSASTVYSTVSYIINSDVAVESPLLENTNAIAESFPTTASFNEATTSASFATLSPDLPLETDSFDPANPTAMSTSVILISASSNDVPSITQASSVSPATAVTFKCSDNACETYTPAHLQTSAPLATVSVNCSSEKCVTNTDLPNSAATDTQASEKSQPTLSTMIVNPSTSANSCAGKGCRSPPDSIIAQGAAFSIHTSIGFITSFISSLVVLLIVV